jgi:hypothetical protein
MAALTAALVLGSASTAGAVAITNLSVSLDPGNTANFLDDVGAVGSQLASNVSIISSSAAGFVTRYQEGVYTDAGGNGAATNVITLNSSYTISFDVINAVGSAWRLDIATSRNGAFTAVTDGAGSWALTLGSVAGSRSGVGTLSAGSLNLTGIARTTGTNTTDTPFNQSAVASISGTGNGTVTLTFLWSAVAETIVAGNGNNAQGDEAAIRLGINENLTSFTAGAYPGDAGTGVPNRTAANDGHFVDLDLFDLGPVPEPDTALMLGMGLAILAAQGRRRTMR